MFRSIVLLLSVLAVLAAASPVIPDRRIAGGLNADTGSAPWQVSLRNSFNIHFCGGSVINSRWVLSAAQCLHGRLATTTMAVVGTNALNFGGMPSFGFRIITHPGYAANIFENDIGVMQTATIMFFGTLTQPLPLGNSFVDGGVQGRFNGWGHTQNGGSFSNLLQTIQLRTLTNAECRNAHTAINAFRVADNTLCTFTREGQGACNGDNGGVLVINNYAAGVYSWSDGCADGRPDVYARVSSHHSWLTAIIN